MFTRNIQQTVTFKASPEDVYEALMDSGKHAEFTGAAADISREVGGKFSAYDGWIAGENTELVPGRKIVQQWRGEDWPQGHFSKVTFLFSKVKEGTKLQFAHENVPNEFYEDIKKGWNEFYWERMKETFGW